MIWDRGLSAQMLLQGNIKKHCKFVHVRKHKYLNKTPYDLYELFTCLFEGA